MKRSKIALRRRNEAGWWPKVRRCLVIGFSVWAFLVVAFRVVAPPFTPLMIIRSVEYWFSDTPVTTRWRWVAIERIPRHVQQAVVAAEDARFMQHWGIDTSELDDVIDDAADGRRVRGASTITMQTVKNLFLWPGRSYLRKAVEGAMAPIAGTVWGKKRTLELYLNVIEWGEGIYGIEAAAQHYYHKSATQLSLAEAGSLAAVLPSPRTIHPHRLSRVSRKRYARIVHEAAMTRVP